MLPYRILVVPTTGTPCYTDYLKLPKKNKAVTFLENNIQGFLFEITDDPQNSKLFTYYKIPSTVMNSRLNSKIHVYKYQRVNNYITIPNGSKLATTILD